MYASNYIRSLSLNGLRCRRHIFPSRLLCKIYDITSLRESLAERNAKIVSETFPEARVDSVKIQIND